MTTRDTSGDAMEAFLRGPDAPPITLSGYDAAIVRQALEEAEAALRQAETSKIYTVSRAARSARTNVLRAWAIIQPSAKR